MFSRVTTAALCGVQARRVTVEADISSGMPVFSMVGYLSSEVREAQDRVRTAIRSLGVSLPVRRITVNLAPADLRKAGAGFDLPIAAAVLAAAELVPARRLEGVMLAGELSLDGKLERIRGVLAMVAGAKKFGCHTCIIPAANLREGSVVEEVKVLGADSLKEVVAFLKGEGELRSCRVDLEQLRCRQEEDRGLDFSDIRGQEALKRAALIAVAGFHNLLIIGPPGAGKTMAAKRIPSILPRTTLEEALEISRIQSVAGTLPEGEVMMLRPFRAPHHTITKSGMAGGGTWPSPGEVTLAHRGVLFLDELPEFRTETLEILRQPMEDGHIVISRNTGSFDFPASFQLVAAMNPCKCGYYPDRSRCRCTSGDVQRYLKSVSAPLLDRIDICVEAQEPAFEEISGLDKAGRAESSGQLRERVRRARRIQSERYQGLPYDVNAHLSSFAAETFCRLGKEQQELMRQMYRKLGLTGRAYMKVLKVARTIADLDGAEDIRTEDLYEAAAFRMIDRKYWGGGM